MTPIKSSLLILAALSGLVSGCMAPMRAGDYPVTGTIVDRCTGAPLEGLTVSLRYSGVSNFRGPIEMTGDPVLTNASGQFYVPPKAITLMTGHGGLAGSTDPWPTVMFYKPGYGSGRISPYREAGKPPISSQDYRAMMGTLLKSGQNCPLRSQAGK
jgi:hypothetical protein